MNNDNNLVNLNNLNPKYLIPKPLKVFFKKNKNK